MPRIISGLYGGRRLKAPAGQHTRPTADRVKEALFSALAARSTLSDCRFLDLFSGSGQIGLEACSRGAGRTVLVERDRHSAAVIRQNMEALGLWPGGPESAVELLTMSVSRAVRLLAERGAAFDVIFLDPPYKEAAKIISQLQQILPATGLLAKAGILILEHESGTVEAETVTNLKLVKRCQYGTAMLSFFMYN